ncbi:MAG: hypothetical protein MJ166_09210, partial [Clostridia bacterium]|nr:hypothetical protein [Clostridia bacterium]
MKKGFVKKIAAALSMILTMSSTMPAIIPTTVLAADKSDIEYAISLMNQYAVITSGDYHNINHTMGPIAVGGDYSGNMEFHDRNVGYITSSGNYDFVVGGSMMPDSKIRNTNDNSDIGVAGIKGNGFGNDLSYDGTTALTLANGATVNGYGRPQLMADPPEISVQEACFSFESKEDLPINFKRLDDGMVAWSDMIDDYCSATETPNNVINVVATSGDVVLEGTNSDINYFNLDVTNMSQLSSIDVKIPAGSKAIINVTGSTSFKCDRALYNGSEVSLDENKNPSPEQLDIQFHNNVIINCANVEQLGNVGAGNVIAPRAVYNCNGNTNGFSYTASLSTYGTEFHAKNCSADFTWVPTTLTEPDNSVGVKGYLTINKTISGDVTEEDIKGLTFTVTYKNADGSDATPIVLTLGNDFDITPKADGKGFDCKLKNVIEVPDASQPVKVEETLYDVADHTVVVSSRVGTAQMTNGAELTADTISTDISKATNFDYDDAYTRIVNKGYITINKTISGDVTEEDIKGL